MAFTGFTIIVNDCRREIRFQLWIMVHDADVDVLFGFKRWHALCLAPYPLLVRRADHGPRLQFRAHPARGDGYEIYG